MNNKKVPVLSIVLYVLAGLVAIFGVWAIEAVHASIGQQQAAYGVFYIMDSYMVNGGLYLILAVILFALGWIDQQISPLTVKSSLPVTGENKPDEQASYETVSVDSVEDVYSGEKAADKDGNASSSSENSDQ